MLEKFEVNIFIIFCLLYKKIGKDMKLILYSLSKINDDYDESEFYFINQLFQRTKKK